MPTDYSSVYVYIFLGLCALIVIAQLVPVVMLMIGAKKAVSA